MAKCIHDPYWTGVYGTCVACRAENAEARVKELEAEANKPNPNDPVYRVETPHLDREWWRYQFAGKAMQASIAGRNCALDPQMVASTSVIFADALIAALEVK